MPKLDKRFEILDYLWEFCKKGSNLPLWISVSRNISRFFFVSFMWCQSEDNSNIGRDKKGPRSHATTTLESKAVYCELYYVKIAFEER